jgi:FtsP/CotA-like multicopper oxidase with cupredoxin domain/uncharacterized protein involved in copper resistance
VKKILYGLIFSLLYVPNIFAAERIVNLVVDYKTVAFAGKSIQAIAVNNKIPAPTLHFKQGDHVSINVYNKLDQETAIHWHGIILPWQMDGVLGVTQQGIPPDGVFHYQFTLHQSGTYWYHAHAGLQEQQGVYGAFLVDPPQSASYHYNKDYVVVLSDWSNTHPDQILANLKKEGDYYSPRFPLQPSLVKFIHDYRKGSASERKLLIDDYKMMQQMRMSIYDMSDVAYDAYLLNGHPKSCPWTGRVKIGDVVRLRFIGAGGSTIFHVKMPGTTMQIVQVDGNDVHPYKVDDFTIAPGETYDVLVKIQKSDPTLIYAESIDTLGAAYGALITQPHSFVDYKNVSAFPEPLPVTRDMMSMMMGMGSMGQMGSMNHVMPMSHSHNMNMDMPTESTLIGDSVSNPTSLSYNTTTGTKYQPLKAAVKTNDPKKPITGVIKMELFGYMDRYIWFINGLPEHKAKPIVIEPGKRYRIIFTNTSMMHHPMHIHGHWFILRKGHGAFDPLMHTIEVTPGATITADLDADASGQWLFHCHLLYHMMSGMARVFQYSTLIDLTQNKARPQPVIKDTHYINRPVVRVDAITPIDVSLVKHHMAHAMSLNFASFLELGLDPLKNVQKINFRGLYGRDYDKVELFVNDAEIKKGSVDNADIDIFYWHLISQFWAIKGGANYHYRPAEKPYWQPGIGIEGLMPYYIDTNIRGYYHSGGFKLDIELARNTQITNNFFIRTEIRSIFASKTVEQAEIGSGLNQIRYILKPYYRLMPGLSAFAEYEHEQAHGSLKNLQRKAGNSSTQNTLTFGLALMM